MNKKTKTKHIEKTTKELRDSGYTCPNCGTSDCNALQGRGPCAARGGW